MPSNTPRQSTAELLRQADIRPSAPRIAILNFVRRVKCHPSAEVVFHALLKNHPTLSLTTVYNTLKLFSEHGLARQLNICGEARFDGQTIPHSHFRCRRCGRIFDIGNPDLSAIRPPEGFLVEQSSLNYTGLCPKCNGKA